MRLPFFPSPTSLFARRCSLLGNENACRALTCETNQLGSLTPFPPAGHDPLGRAHFNGHLVGSRRWIGTTEVYTALTWMGVRCAYSSLSFASFPLRGADFVLDLLRNLAARRRRRYLFLTEGLTRVRGLQGQDH